MTKIEAGRMLNENYLHDPILINTVGHTAGLLLFAVIIALLLRDGTVHRLGQTKMSLIAASLALGWNVGALVTLALPHPGSLLVRVIMTSKLFAPEPSAGRLAACRRAGASARNRVVGLRA